MYENKLRILRTLRSSFIDKSFSVIDPNRPVTFLQSGQSAKSDFWKGWATKQSLATAFNGHYVKFPFMYSGVVENEVRPSFEASISLRSFA